MRHTKCLIIGSGPAGYTAAIYASRAGLKPIMITGPVMGGQLTTTTEIDNFPGYPDGVDGNEMMNDLAYQAERFGTEIIFDTVTRVDFSAGDVHKYMNPSGLPLKIYTEEEEFHADSVIIATGASAKYMGLENEQRLMGKGVSACATCDGFFFKGKKVAVIGGGDTACEEATHLAHICDSVHMLVRGEEMVASKAMQGRVANTDNITILYGVTTSDILGEDEVTGIEFTTSDARKHTRTVDGVFVAIGHTPNSSLFKGQLVLDKDGYINTSANSTSTSVRGVYAAGDVQDRIFRQAITAAGTGCMAALEVERYLSK